MKIFLLIPVLMVSFVCGRKPSSQSSTVNQSANNSAAEPQTTINNNTSMPTETSPASQNSNTSSATIEGLKPQTAGLALRDFDHLDPNTSVDLLRIVNSFIVKVYWKDIQPQENGELRHPNAIDDALTYVRQMNSQNPGLNLNLKIRLYCGIYSPEWLQAKAGTFTLYSGSKNSSLPTQGEVVKFWKPEFLSAFANVQSKLAAAYDNAPEITETVNGGTGITYSEAMIRNVGSNGAVNKNSESFSRSDYTSQKDINAIKSTIDAMKVWKHTRVSMVFTPFFIIQAQKVDEDLSVTKDLLDYFVNTFGAQAVLGNNGLRDKNSGQKSERWQEGGSLDKVYNYLENYNKTKNIGLYFQTATLQRIGNLSSALEQGIERGAGMIELPMGSKGLTKNFSMADLKKYDQMLEAQAKK